MSNQSVLHTTTAVWKCKSFFFVKADKEILYPSGVALLKYQHFLPHQFVLFEENHCLFSGLWFVYSYNLLQLKIVIPVNCVLFS